MDYAATIRCNVPPEKAARLITDDLEAWWGTRIERTDDGFTVRFNDSHATFAFDPGSTDTAFGWTCTDANMIIEDVTDASEWRGTQLLWEVTADGPCSRVTLTHKGLTPHIECFDVCQRGWQHYFETSLRDHLNGREASPSLT